MWVYAFRNALVPVVTVVGITMAILIGGAVVTEIVFNIPGLGRLIISAILRRDYPVVQAAVSSTTPFTTGKSRLWVVENISRPTPRVVYAIPFGRRQANSHKTARHCVRRRGAG